MITVEPTTVWAAFGSFVLGMIVGALIVLDEMKRARRRWREATRTWHEIEAVALELRGEHTELPRHNAPDMVVAIREGVTEQLKKRRHGTKATIATKFRPGLLLATAPAAWRYSPQSTAPHL